MSEKRVVVLSCDMCESEELVETHKMSVDAALVDFEACDTCFDALLVSFTRVAAVGRKPPKLTKVSRKADVFDFPGESWRFTAHSLVRMGERHITPHAACLAADNPEITRGGTTIESQIRQRNGVKVVVDPERRQIITVSNADEEVDAVA